MRYINRSTINTYRKLADFHLLLSYSYILKQSCVRHSSINTNFCNIIVTCISTSALMMNTSSLTECNVVDLALQLAWLENVEPAIYLTPSSSNCPVCFARSR